MKIRILDRLDRFQQKLKEVLGIGPDPQVQRLAEETRDMKKAVRRQAVINESLMEELLGKIEAMGAGDLDLYLDLARAYFFLDKNLRETEGAPPGRVRAAGMVWEKLEALLASAGIEMIRLSGVDFDPGLHEAVGKEEAPGDGRLTVKEIIQPGHKLKGKVIRPAKAVVHQAQQSENSNEEVAHE